MMNGRKKSDPVIVAGKPTNKAAKVAAEPVEPRTGAKGNASQQSTLRTQCRKRVSQALERIRQVRRHTPKVGAVCGNSARTDLCGGAAGNSRPYRDKHLLRQSITGCDPQRTQPFCWYPHRAVIVP